MGTRRRKTLSTNDTVADNRDTSETRERKRYPWRIPPEQRNGNKFLKGNNGGPGNPITRRRYKWRMMLEEEFAKNKDGIRTAVKRLILEAAAGDLEAIKVLLDRLVGKPAPEQLKEKAQIEAEGDELIRQYNAHQQMRQMRDRQHKRRLELSTDIIENVEVLASEGMPSDAICDMAGIRHEDFLRWMKTGQEVSDSDNEPKRKHDRLCLEFVLAYRRGTASYRHRLIAAAEERTRTIELLERRDPRSFGPDADAGDEEQYDPDERFL